MMYHGKHAKKTKQTGLKKSAILLAAFVLIFTVSAGATLAYIIDSTNGVTNIFTPSKVACDVTEDNFTSTSKEGVAVKNSGDTDAYIRAAIVVTWKDDVGGNVYGKAPVLGTDYTLELGSSKWAKIGDYYYYQGSVAPNNSTEDLIKKCTPKAKCENNIYQLSVEILAEAIQAEPIDAVQEAWGVTVNSNGTITP